MGWGAGRRDPYWPGRAGGTGGCVTVWVALYFSVATCEVRCVNVCVCVCACVLSEVEEEECMCGVRG